jgi:ferredoxin
MLSVGAPDCILLSDPLPVGQEVEMVDSATSAPSIVDGGENLCIKCGICTLFCPDRCTHPASFMADEGVCTSGSVVPNPGGHVSKMLADGVVSVNEPGGIRTRDALIKRYLALDGVAP